ncbi:MAG TPA: DUF3108 domain-containing protein [Stellaceae bacterium]|nr:DUF3108 domain-containing protein [Stellaceae bacterium]
MSQALSRAPRADELSALYHVTWAGVPAAEIRLSLHEDGAAYRNEFAISSEGLPHLVTHFRGTAVAQGRFSGITVAPASFDANYDLRKRKDRKLRMSFVSRNGAIFAERGAADTSRKPELKEQFRRDVIDPLSVITQIRARIRRGETGFTLPVYDGARRFNAEVRVLPRDAKDPGIHLALALRAIAGFKGESSDDGDPDDAPRPASLTLSDDGRLMPLAMEVKIWFLPLQVTLTRVCDGIEPCSW